MDKKLLIGLAIAIGLAALIIFGFDKHEAKVDSYSTKFKTYVLANYSETTTGIDMDGEFYSETDYWDERVSEVWKVTTVNGMLAEYYCPKEAIYGIYCKTPPKTQKHPINSDFDGYQDVREINYYVKYSDGSYYENVSRNTYDKAKVKLGKTVVVKTWYGLSYGIE